VFGSVNARYGALDYTIQRLLKAAKTGKRADIEAQPTITRRTVLRDQTLPPHGV
jgi:hypothetical protein